MSNKSVYITRIRDIGGRTISIYESDFPIFVDNDNTTHALKIKNGIIQSQQIQETETGFEEIGTSKKYIQDGKNIQSGTVNFENTSVAVVTFEQPFGKKPMINLTPGNNLNFPVFRTEVTINDFKIKFKTNFTGEVDWIALDRNST